MPPATCVMASRAHGIWIKEQLDSYANLCFVKENGSFDLKPNTMRILETMQANGFIADGEYKVYKDVHVFPVDFFSPRQTTGEFLLTENTYCDHHFIGSWTNEQQNWKVKVGRMLSQRTLTKIIKLKRKLIG